MSEIREIEIQPATQGATCYVVGDNNGIRIGGLDRKTAPVVSAIEIRVDETTKNPIIEIKVAGETYCIYENVPYAAYYKTSFHQ